MGNKNTKKFVQEVDTIKSGCYVRNPEAIGVKFERAIVPLRSIDYHLEIVNSLVNITLRQTYFNPIDKFLEVDYSLPISPESSVYKFEVEFNNVKIEGTIKDKEIAKKQHEKAKSQGKQVVLATIDPQSKDIFNIEIGNIPPKTQFVVTICLLQQMKISLNTFYQLQIPSKISPRYMNQVDGVVRYSETMQQQGESSGPADYKWSFKIDLKTTRRVVFFDSPSHCIKLTNQNQAGTETFLELDKAQIPQKDFVFVYTTENFHLLSYVLGQTDISTTVMLSFIPKFCDLQVTDAYKSYIQNKPYETDILTSKGEYVFLLDRSGSMSGTRINQAKKSLILFLKSLPEDSYFNVTSFGDGYRSLFNKSEKTSSQTIQTAINQIQSMSADMGGTQIYNPLLNLLKGEVFEGYPRHIFLLTDGDVSNTQGVIRMVKKYTKYSRVHSIGIGSGASISLIQGCAKSGKGKHIMISDEQNPSQKIIQLLQSTLTAIISKVDLKYQTEQQIQSIVPNPKSIPYILKDEVANFFITFKGRLETKTTFTFQYEDSVSKLTYKADIQVDPKSLNQPFVDKMAHLKVLRLLQHSAKEENNIQDHMYYVKVKDFKQEAIDYSIKHQILSQYTAFSCIGKQLVDGKYQEYKDLGIHKVFVEQPNLMMESELYYKDQISSLSSNFNNNIQYDLCDMEEQCCEMEMEMDIPQMQYKGSNDLNMLMNRAQIIKQSFQVEYQKCSLQQMQPLVQQVHDIPQISNVNNTVVLSDISIPVPKIINNQNLVEWVIRLQATDGSWNEPQLLQKLSKNPNDVTEISKKLNSQVVITKLVILWFQKNQTSKQYNLIIKKALAWLKKKITQYQIQENQLNVIQSI